MVPTQTLENFPPFGDNATKVQPDNAKYAAGFQPSDVYPAEWVNWVWGKSSNGVTKLNTGVDMMEREINNVLGGADKTPDATKDNQLLQAIQKLISDAKAQAILAAHPIGSLYWSSQSTDPGTLFGGTWTRIKDKFILAAGDTYTNGATGGAATVTLTTNNMPSHTHGYTPAGSISVTTNPTFTGSSHSHSYTPAGSISVTTNPTFTGSEHSHSYTPAGTVSSHTHALSGTGATAAASSTATVNNTTEGNAKVLTDNSGGVNRAGGTISMKRYSPSSLFTVSVTTTLSGNVTSTQPTFTGTAATLKATQGGSISGGAYKFTGTAASLSATQGGSISGGAYKFTGTAGTTGSTGSGTAVDKMPPYLVKYCWERTA